MQVSPAKLRNPIKCSESSELQMSLVPDFEAIPAFERQSWQQQLSTAWRSASELLNRLQITSDTVQLPDPEFPLLVPESFVRRMRPGDPLDPLLRQVLPTDAEQVPSGGFVSDPVGDLASRRAPGLLQKYAGRALLIATGTCAVHCRYCFRRNYPYQDEPRTLAEWQPALDTIRADESLAEVIFSGGDPLMLSDQRLQQLCKDVDEIPHVERIRFHTRLPIVLPARVTSELMDHLTELRAQLIVVVHANHPAEIQADCKAALKLLAQSSATVLNQAVLLQGINDSTAIQAELCRQLVNIGVLPYYLHQLDRVDGAAHFETPLQLGQQIIRELRAILPGYAVPRFVQELPGESSKTLMERR